jgi:hypothetical protein
MRQPLDTNYERLRAWCDNSLSEYSLLYTNYSGDGDDGAWIIYTNHIEDLTILKLKFG